MTDFFQILEREVEPTSKLKESIAPKLSGQVLGVEKRAVEKIKKTKSDKTTKSVVEKTKKRGPKPKPVIEEKKDILSYEAINPIWLTMSEAAKLGGLQKKTIKRAIRSNFLKYKIVENRYLVDLRSVLLYLASKKKLWNKLKEYGLGQYVEKWRN